jgi:hypothetical protein
MKPAEPVEQSEEQRPAVEQRRRRERRPGAGLGGRAAGQDPRGARAVAHSAAQAKRDPLQGHGDMPHGDRGTGPQTPSPY